jgi:hypothetical protein
MGRSARPPSLTVEAVSKPMARSQAGRGGWAEVTAAVITFTALLAWTLASAIMGSGPGQKLLLPMLGTA